MTDSPPSNVPEYSVSEISGALRRTVEDAYSLVRVRGEISGFKRHSSGHLYFALKDADAVLDAVCWRGQAGKLAVIPEDGLEIIATGRLTTYPGRSKYQMVVERMEVAGQGALLKLLEDRRRKLAAEGLFEASRKRPLPFLPNVIGIVTSPTGAVIRDILHRLAERFPRRVLLWPVAVQGDTAAQQVAAAIRGFNNLPHDGPVPRPDVLIVARGGGSIEDLWAFNEEIVVRAAAESRIPLISAVGHETDTTLIDFASDLRAPTPTAAAEKAVPVRADLLVTVAEAGSRLVGAATRGLNDRRNRVEAMSRALPHPRAVMEDCTRRMDDRTERLRLALPNMLHRRSAELDRLAARLKHPREVLAVRTHALESTASRLHFAMSTILTTERAKAEKLAARLKHPGDVLAARSHALENISTRLHFAISTVLATEKAKTERQRLQLDQSAERLGPGMARLLAERGQRLESMGKLLESCSYRKILERGYAVVRDSSGHPVSSAQAAQPGSAMSVEFSDGSVAVHVDGQAPPPKTAKAEHKPGRAKDDRQGSFL